MKQFYLLNLVLLIACGICSADAVYTVSLNTAALIGNANNPFALDFQLTSGNTTTGVINAATLSNFTFGTGGSAGTGSPFGNSGNASGNLNSSIVLNTSAGNFFNEFSQFFMPGNLLSFQLDLSNNPQPGGTPDEFTFQLIDKSGREISTTDPSGSNSVAVIDLTGGGLSPAVFAFDADGLTSTPEITNAVPEPSSFAYTLGMGAFLIFVKRIRRARHPKQRA